MVSVLFAFYMHYAFDNFLRCFCIIWCEISLLDLPLEFVFFIVNSQSIDANLILFL